MLTFLLVVMAILLTVIAVALAPNIMYAIFVLACGIVGVVVVLLVVSLYPTFFLSILEILLAVFAIFVVARLSQIALGSREDVKNQRVKLFSVAIIVVVLAVGGTYIGFRYRKNRDINARNPSKTLTAYHSIPGEITLGQSPKHVYVDLDRATDAAISSLTTEGTFGLHADIENCYKNERHDQMYCIYFDLASAYIATGTAAQLHMKPIAFFTNKNIMLRVGRVLLTRTTLNRKSANQYLRKLQVVIRNMVTKKILRRHYASGSTATPKN